VGPSHSAAKKKKGIRKGNRHVGVKGRGGADLHHREKKGIVGLGRGGGVRPVHCGRGGRRGKEDPGFKINGKKEKKKKKRKARSSLAKKVRGTRDDLGARGKKKKKGGSALLPQGKREK